MKKFYILKYEDNWADEMDIQSFVILNEEDKIKFYDKAKNNLDKLNKELVVCLGTNEEIIFKKGSDFIKKLKVKEMSETEANIIKNYISKKYYGPADILWNIKETLRDVNLLQDEWTKWR